MSLFRPHHREAAGHARETAKHAVNAGVAGGKIVVGVAEEVGHYAGFWERMGFHAMAVVWRAGTRAVGYSATSAVVIGTGEFIADRVTGGTNLLVDAGLILGGVAAGFVGGAIKGARDGIKRAYNEEKVKAEQHAKARHKNTEELGEHVRRARHHAGQVGRILRNGDQDPQ